MQPIIDLSLSSPWFFYSMVGIVSLMIGSFLNVVIHRLPIMMERAWKQEYQGTQNPFLGEYSFNQLRHTRRALCRL